MTDENESKLAALAILAGLYGHALAQTKTTMAPEAIAGEAFRFGKALVDKVSELEKEKS